MGKSIFTKLKAHSGFLKDFHAFKKASQVAGRMLPLWKDRNKWLYDKTEQTDFNAGYVYHTSWAARVIAKTRPEKHVDISSSLFFSGITSAFVPVEFYDYRPANILLSDLRTGKADLTKLFFEDNSLPSLSCMHTVEHIGLGRYGDPIDADGDKKAISELKRVVARGGNFLFVVPIGRPRIVYNAHRIYSYEEILSYFPEFELVEFSLIPDNALKVGMLNGAGQEVKNQIDACGCFWFKKK